MFYMMEKAMGRLKGASTNTADNNIMTTIISGAVDVDDNDLFHT